MINYIELAKECGARVGENSLNQNKTLVVIMHGETLHAFVNAVIEQCAKVSERMPMNTTEQYNDYRSSDDCKAMAWDIQHAIRALKVKW